LLYEAMISWGMVAHPNRNPLNCGRGRSIEISGSFVIVPDSRELPMNNARSRTSNKDKAGNQESAPKGRWDRPNFDKLSNKKQLQRVAE
jgi:hypothetical protein